MQNVIDEIARENPRVLGDMPNARLVCALAERDATGAKEALNALGERPLEDDGASNLLGRSSKVLSLAWRKMMRKRTLLSLLPARSRRRSLNPNRNYGPPWCVLGLIDAALGRTQEALREGNRAVELVP